MSADDDAHEARIAAYIRETVAKAPPLTDWQRERLRTLLAPARPADSPGRCDPSPVAASAGTASHGPEGPSSPHRHRSEPDAPTQVPGRGLTGPGGCATRREPSR